MLLLKLIKFITNYVFTSILIPLSFVPYYIFNWIFIDNKKSRCWDKCIEAMLYIMNATHKWVNKDQELIQKGFILANHRNSFDYNITPLIAQSSTIISESMFDEDPVICMYGHFENRLINITKDDTRDTLRYKMFTHINGLSPISHTKRICIFPEGRYRHYTIIRNIDDAICVLNTGMLKIIYEYHVLPVQVLITKNKENIIDRRTCTLTYGTILTSTLGKHIYPENYGTFDEFYHAIAEEWYKQWNIVYKI